jgi:hypothetical protein
VQPTSKPDHVHGVTDHDAARLERAFHPLAYLSTTGRDGGVYHVSYEI